MSLETILSAFMEDGFENSISNDGKVGMDELKAEIVTAITSLHGELEGGGGGGGGVEPDIVIEFNGGTNVGGGAITAYFDDPRVFNSIVVDKFGTVSLSNGGAYIDGIPIGTYRVEHYGDFHSTGMSKNAIYNLTAGVADLCTGNPVDTTNGGRSSGSGILVCSSISTIFQHYFRNSSPAGTEAFGKPLPNKPKNIHARIELWKIS